MKIKLIVLALCSFFLMSLNPVAHAEKDFSSFSVTDIFIEDEGDPTTEDDDQSVIGNLVDQAENSDEINSPIMAFILRIINILSLLVGTFAFVMIVIGGFIFATSGGDEGQVDKGKAILTQAIVGLVVAFLSYFIVFFIQSFLYN